jgi:hypothetical protein
VASQDVDGCVRMGVSAMNGFLVMGFVTARRISSSAAEKGLTVVVGPVTEYTAHVDPEVVVDAEPVDRVRVDVGVAPVLVVDVATTLAA